MYRSFPDGGQVEEVKVDPYRELGEAIRAGCRGTRQARGQLFVYRLRRVRATCALGAALHARGFDDPEAEACKLFPVLLRQVHGPSHFGMLRWVIMILNDHWGWSREHIADWVESLAEPKSGTPRTKLVNSANPEQGKTATSMARANISG